MYARKRDTPTEQPSTPIKQISNKPPLTPTKLNLGSKQKEPIDIHELMRQQMEEDITLELKQDKFAADCARPRVRSDNVKIDTHELLKKQMFEETPDDPVPSKFVRGMTNYDIYFELDSFYALTQSIPGIGLYIWQLNVGNTQNNLIGISENLFNITELQTSGFILPAPVDIPYVVNSPIALPSTGLILSQNATLPVNSAPAYNPLTQFPYGNRIAIDIKETTGVNVRGFNQSNITFEYRLKALDEVADNRIEAIPFANTTFGDIYKFRQPVNLERLSFQFRNPVDPLILPKAVYSVVSNTEDDNVYFSPSLSFNFQENNQLPL